MNRVEKIFFFTVSPIISLPITLYGIYKRSFLSLILLAFTIGVLSFLYLPTMSNDKARYFELYNNFALYGYDYLTEHLATRSADFVIHFLIYFFAINHIPLPYLILLISTFTAGSYFYFFSKFALFSKKESFNYFLCFIIVLLSFSLPDLLSGIRFYFGTAFLILAYYFFFFSKKKLLSICLLILAILTHFSLALFIPVFILLYYMPNHYKLFRWMMIFSFLFILAPKQLVISIIDTLGLSGGFETKAELYLEGEDFIEKGITEGSQNYIWVYLFSIGWSFFAYLYLLLTVTRKSMIRNILYCSFAIVNIFYVITTVYARYLIVLKFLFILLLIYELIEYKNRKPLYIMLLFVIVNTISSFIILRNNLIESYLSSRIFSIVQLFANQNMDLVDFLR